MDTSYGLLGIITPTEPLKGKKQSFVFESFSILIEDGVLEIGYNNEALETRARAVVHQHLAAFNLDQGTRYNVALNQSWRPGTAAGKAVGLTLLPEKVKVGDSIRVNKATQDGRALIIEEVWDSDYFGNQSQLVAKCEKDPALAAALNYFDEEVVDAERPLYGIYKAIEAMSKSIGGAQNWACSPVVPTTRAPRHL